MTQDLKRLGNIFDKICSIDNLRIAHAFKSKARRIASIRGRSSYHETVSPVMSYYGWFKPANAWSLWNKYIDKSLAVIAHSACRKDSIKIPKQLRLIK